MEHGSDWRCDLASVCLGIGRMDGRKGRAGFGNGKVFG
jgi:hypothetical protein